MNIVVLCGGLSSERDVSLTSGSMVAAALRRSGHRAVLIDAFFGYTGTYSSPEDIFSAPYDDSIVKIGENVPNLAAIRESRRQDNDSRVGDNLIEICRAADIVFMALHGEDGENGKLQALFDIMGIKYTGCGYLGSAIAMNKGLTKKLLAAAGVQTPDGITLYKGQTPYGSVGFPCVVKPCSGGSSVGTSIVETEKDYLAAVELAFQYEEAVIVEKYVKGRELTIGVLGGKPMPAIEIIPKTGFYDYKNKYQAGLTEEICPAPLTAEETAELSNLAVQVNAALMLDTYCRVDFLLGGDDTFYCLEANTLPGMTPTSLIPQMAAQQGLSYEELCEAIIRESLKKYN